MSVKFQDFLNFDIRAGTVTKAINYNEAKYPAIKLWLDFGKEIGEKKSSAQLTDCYEPSDLIGRQVIALVNIPPRQIGKFMSEVLVLGLVYGNEGVRLIVPDESVANGAKLL